MVKIIITAQTGEEAQQQLQSLLAQSLAKTAPKTKLQAQESDAPKPAPKAKPDLAIVEPQPETQPEAPQPEEELPQPQAEAAPQTTSGPAETEVRALLNDVRQKRGPKAVRAILDEMGVRSFPDVPKERYAEVVFKANAALTEG